jgi:hypothetical protein
LQSAKLQQWKVEEWIVTTSQRHKSQSSFLLVQTIIIETLNPKLFFPHPQSKWEYFHATSMSKGQGFWIFP